MSPGGYIRLRITERVSSGNPDLLLDQIQAGDHLRHRMLYLDAGIHLQEVEPAFILIEDEFHGTGAFIADPPGNQKGRLTNLQPLLRR